MMATLFKMMGAIVVVKLKKAGIAIKKDASLFVEMD
jgi:glycine cleavage system H lipoate-binding protein